MANTNEELTADLMGMQTAFGAVIRALIKTHPDPEALIAACEYERQESLSFLTAAPVPERVLDAFHVGWVQVGPANLDG